jgi:hypothetical protein
MKSQISLSLVAVAALFLGSRAFATPITNIITNGGFETGDFTGWTQGGNTGDTGVNSDSHTGNFAAYMGPGKSAGTLTQNLSTVVGASYELSFFMFGEQPETERLNQVRSLSAISFQVFWGGVMIFDNSTPPSDWTQFQFLNLVATGSTTELKFVFRNDPSFFHLDDVVAGISAVPETLSTLWLALPVFGMLYFARLRRKTA